MYDETECIRILREVNGLVGAVNDDTIEKVREIIQLYNEYAWLYERVQEILQLDSEYADAEQKLKMIEEYMEKMKGGK